MAIPIIHIFITSITIQLHLSSNDQLAYPSLPITFKNKIVFQKILQIKFITWGILQTMFLSSHWCPLMSPLEPEHRREGNPAKGNMGVQHCENLQSEFYIEKPYHLENLLREFCTNPLNAKGRKEALHLWCCWKMRAPRHALRPMNWEDLQT